jgi:TolB-like protein/Flp pilus assembly protein TadD
LRYIFEDYSLDTDRRELRRGAGLVQLEPKVFDLLAYVVRSRERVVSKDDLIASIWDGRIVSESTLTSCINGARCAIGDSGDGQRLIKTLPRKGIRFVGTVREEQFTTDVPLERTTVDLSGKPSVAVLPFQTVAGDAELEGFADGLTEDVITALSRVKALWVIARNTMFTYKGRSNDVRTVGEDLGVRYVLEGSVRKADGRLRMTAQLVEAESGHHIWAEKIDRAGGSLFELQDDLTQSIVASVQVQLIVSEGKSVARMAEMASGIGDLVARARERLYHPTANGFDELVSLAQKALALDPDNGEGCQLLATGIWHQAYRGSIPWDRAAADRVMLLALRAIVAGHADEYAHWTLALAHLMASQHLRAIVSLRSALDINPSFSLGYGTVGTVLAWAGESDESIANNELALKINPRDPLNSHRYFGLALAHYLASRYRESLENASRVIEAHPDWWLGVMVYVASLAQSGRVEEAAVACAELRRAKQDATVASLNGLPFAKESDRIHVAEGLRKAGLPEQ